MLSAFIVGLLLLIYASIGSTRDMKRSTTATSTDAVEALLYLYACMSSAYEWPTSPELGMTSNSLAEVYSAKTAEDRLYSLEEHHNIGYN